MNTLGTLSKEIQYIKVIRPTTCTSVFVLKSLQFLIQFTVYRHASTAPI